MLAVSSTSDLQTVTEGVPLTKYDDESPAPVNNTPQLTPIYNTGIKAGDFVLPAVISRTYEGGYESILKLLPKALELSDAEKDSGNDQILTENPVSLGVVAVTKDIQSSPSPRILMLYHTYLLEYVHGGNTKFSDSPIGYAQLSSCDVQMHGESCAVVLTYNSTPTSTASATLTFYTVALANAAVRLLKLAGASNTSLLYDMPVTTKESNTAALGKGRFAQVIKCRRRSQETEIALKIIDKNSFWKRVKKGQERSDTLVRELATSAICASSMESAKFFVKIYGVTEDEKRLVIEMEYVKGRDLFQVLKSSYEDHISEALAKNYVYNIMQALAHLERLGVAHRDIKLANIMSCVDSSGESADGVFCKIGDFGMATTVSVDDGLIRGRCGTPGYVAPEILTATAKSGYRNKVDLFSAGVVMYIVLCGYEPFYGETDAQVIDANKAADVEFHDTAWDDVTEDAKELIRLLLEKDPEKRIEARDAMNHAWFDDCGCKKVQQQKEDEEAAAKQAQAAGAGDGGDGGFADSAGEGVSLFLCAIL
jgi:predicted Ser/Thr protein kinase